MKIKSLSTHHHTEKVVTGKISRFLKNQNQNQIPLLVPQTGRFLCHSSQRQFNLTVGNYKSKSKTYDKKLRNRNRLAYT